MQIICCLQSFTIRCSGCRELESVSANQKWGRSSLYTEQHEKHTLDFEYFLSANFLWNPQQQLNRSKWTNQKQVWPVPIDDTFAWITLTCAENHEYFIGTKFHKHSPKGSMEKAEYILFMCLPFITCMNAYFFKWIPNWAKFLKILRNSRSLLDYKFWFI